MFRFLRFELGGTSALLWMILFLCPYLDIVNLLNVDATKVFALVFGSVALSIPLGNYIHQCADAIFNPFSRRRLFFWERSVIARLRNELGSGTARFSDATFQVILVFAKAGELVSKSVRKTAETQFQIKPEILREEISNRYSYYYARLENGLIAPFVGYLVARLVIVLLEGTDYVALSQNFSQLWIVGIAAVVGLATVWRIPQLFRELDDLENALIDSRRSIWARL